MVVENMTGREFPLIDCLELSINVNANHSPGTDLTVLGPYIAERFDLDLVITDDPELLRAHLKKGYMAVACSAGDRPEEDYIGIMEAHNVYWQAGELGKVDEGGGGTVAQFIAGMNIDVVDLGVPVMSMHAPMEIVSKMDVYEAYNAFVAFYK